MENLYRELWGCNPYSLTKAFALEVPEPQVYLEPGHRARLQQVDDFPLTGISEKKTKQFFHKLETVNELPCGLTKILVTTEYFHVEGLLRGTELGKWPGGTKRPAFAAHLDFNVAGQPGSGKSVFLSYLLAQRLAARQPTVYRFGDESCYLFTRTVHGKRIHLNELFHELDEETERSLWILTDEALVNPSWNRRTYSWFIVLAASPAEVKASGQWEKDRNVNVHYMSNWEWREIFAAFSLQNPDPSQESVANLYTSFVCFGPVARTCLSTIPVTPDEVYDEHVGAYQEGLDREIDTLIALGDYPNLSTLLQPGTFHKIGLMEPGVHGRSFKTRIITRYVAYRMAKVESVVSRRNRYRVFEYLSTRPTLRSSAGWFFEAYAHDWFRRGGEFQADKLPIESEVPEILKFKIERSDEANYFANPKDMASQVQVGKYFQPYGKTQESFDGLLFDKVDSLILFQCTMAEKHEVISHGVRDLLRALPVTVKTISIIFVVPNDRIRNYSNSQKIPSDLRLSARGLSVEQFRMPLPDENILLLLK